LALAAAGQHERSSQIGKVNQGRRPPKFGQLQDAAQIFEACDALDNAAEFAVYEQVSIRAAMDEFLNDSESPVIRALREVTSPRWHPLINSSLPIFPSAAARLMRTDPDRVSVSELDAIAASDPVLAGRLLRTANSAIFGPRSPIVHLRQAIMRLGLVYARKALLAGCFDRLFVSGSLPELWTHSRVVAATSYELAATCDVDQELAYVSGLLHDIGRLAIDACPATIRREEEAWMAAGFPLIYAETIVYGQDHARIGGELLDRWHLPSEIIEAITLHHSPELTESRLVGILCLAEDHSITEMRSSEHLSAGMRRRAAAQNIGIAGTALPAINREAPIFALAS
jgi:putative nucleotidyltransferase with HDIG domain